VRPCRLSKCLLLVVLLVCGYGVAASYADTVSTMAPKRAKTAHAPPFTIWDVQLGGLIADIPERDLAEVACGTNGGPPSRPLEFIAEFKKCVPEADGLREVYFSYDDEFEYRARALELPTEVALYGGTSVAGHPVVVSVLVDDGGRLRGRRIISDSRADVRNRRRAASLAPTLKSRFGKGWSCTDTPPQDGEEPLAGVFINQTCTKTDASQGRLALVSRYMRKKGQRARDPVTGKQIKGAYESYTRFEQRRP